MSTDTLEYAQAFSTTRQRDVNRIRRWTQRLIEKGQLKADQTLVDIGCGCGRFTLPLAAWVSRAIGIDQNQHMLDAAAERDAVNVTWICARADALPLRNGEANVALASMLIEHLQDKNAFFKEVRRVLKPGSIFLVRTMFPADIERTTWYRFLPVAAKAEAERTLQFSEFESLSGAHGFCVDSVHSYVDSADDNSRRSLQERLRRRGYEVLSKISDEEIGCALKAIDGASEPFREELASSLVVLRRR